MIASWELPYRSQRQPVLGDDVIATSQPLAVQAGMRAYERGGNAADAAVAAAMALTVVEPTSNGIGGDAFAIVAEPDGTVHGLNASGRSPAALDPAEVLERGTVPLRGWGSVTVPGAVSAWVDLSERFGRLSLDDLAVPAIRYAEEGFPVSPLTAAAWRRAEEVLGDRPDSAATFLRDGRAPRPGERFACPDQARTLGDIVDSAGTSFYRGALAERIAAHAAAEGGALTVEDLASHEPLWVEPLGITYGDATVLELPPNTQGLAALVALGVLDRTGHRDLDPDGDEATHLAIEAVKLGLADAHRVVGDPEHVGDVPHHLARPRRLDDLAHRVSGRAGDPGHGRPWPGGTVYLAAADREGRLVSYIQSNYAGFGSGIVVPGTGIALHNRGACFVADPGHPNAIAARKRPYNTIIPGMVVAEDGAAVAFGVMGGPMQPQGHTQLLARLLGHRQNPQAAIDAWRWRVDTGTVVHVEEDAPEAAMRGLTARGHEVVRIPRWDPSFGGAQLAMRVAGGNLAASDPRKDGHAAAR